MRVAPLALLAACHGNPDALMVDAAPPSASAPPKADAAAVDAGAPPRCTLATTTVAAPWSSSFGTGAELGEAVATADGFALGALRSQDGNRVAAVVRLGAGAPVVVTDLGPAPRDGLAPQPFLRGGEVYALAFVATRSPPTKPHGPVPASLTLFHVAERAERLLELAGDPNPAAAYDVVVAEAPASPVGALVAWEESDGRARASGYGRFLDHAVVRVAALSPDLHAARPASIVRPVAPSGEGASEAGVDAGDPRLAVRDGGYWLTYVARRPEQARQALPLPAGEIETPSEESTYGWVEALLLGADGAPKAPARRLTPANGHLVSYAMWSHDGRLDVVAKDEGHGTLGGSLARITWRGEGEPETHLLVRGGVEEELPPVIVPDVAGGAWLSFFDVGGEARLLPLASAASAPGGSDTRGAVLASREPLLATARLLGVRDGRLAVAMTKDEAWSLAWATCSP